MSVLVVGECLGTRERTAGKPGNTWQETSIVVLDRMVTTEVVVASVEKFRGSIPTAGELVALECSVRGFKRKSGDVGYSFTAFGRAERVESVLSQSATTSATA